MNAAVVAIPVVVVVLVIRPLPATGSQVSEGAGLARHGRRVAMRARRFRLARPEVGANSGPAGQFDRWASVVVVVGGANTLQYYML